MLAQFFVITRNGFDFNTALIDSAVTQLVFAIAGYAINTSMHAYQPSARNSWYVLAQTIGLAAVSAGVQRFILLEWLGDTIGYADFMDKSIILRAGFGWLMIVIIATLTWFWVYATDNREAETRKAEAIKFARDAELANLRQQLQPHFLFNSLNSISALAGSQPEQARKMIQQLSDFLRGTIKKDDASRVTLEEELHHLQLYLDIEKVRFGHRLKADIEKSEKSLTAQMPSLLLQPIVENAIKFGLYDTVGEICISISTRMENNMLLIEVKNPFDPSTAAPKRGTGFGLSSVNRRLYLLYLRNDLLTTSQEASVFTTTIKIPQAS